MLEDMSQRAPVLGELTTRTLFIDNRAAETDAEGNRIFQALAYGYDDGTPDTVDTYGTTMAPGAMAHVTPDDFRILVYHKQDEDPVGLPLSIEESPQGPVVRWVFAPTARAQEIETLVEGGFLRAVSVGFIPRDGYIRKSDGVVVFTKVDLHELSIVNCPSSKKARIEVARELGISEEDLGAVFGDILRTPEEIVEDEIKAVLKRHAAALRGQSMTDVYVVVSLFTASDDGDDDDDEPTEDPDESDVDPALGTQLDLSAETDGAAATVSGAEQAPARSVRHRRSRRRR